MIVLSPYIMTREGRRTIYDPPFMDRLAGSIELRSRQQRANNLGVGLFLYRTHFADSRFTILSRPTDSLDQALDRTLAPADIANWKRLTGNDQITGTNLRDIIWSHLTMAGDTTGRDTAGVLLPLQSGDMNVWLGQKILTRRITTQSDEWNRILAVEQESYRAAREYYQATYPAGSPRRNHYLRILGGLADKYRVDYRVFLAGLPDEGVERPATTFSDNFNGSDSDTPGIQLTWAEVSGDWDNTSNRAGLSTTGGSTPEHWMRSEHDLSSADHRSQIMAAVINANHASGSTALGPCTRFNAAAEECYWAGLIRAAAGTYISRSKQVTGGTETTIGSDTSGPSVVLPQERGLESEGTDLRRYNGATLEDTATDATHATAVRCGLGGSIPSGGNGGSPYDIQADDYVCNDLGGAVPIPLFMHHYKQLAGIG